MSQLRVDLPGEPPEANKRLRRAAQRLTRPVEAFLAAETAGGVLLMLAAAIALIWANSPWKESYQHLWHTPLGFGAANHELVKPLHFWINDGLMTIFFLLAGLEIKRELVQGELSDLRRAALPVLAAVGGMVVPALIFLAFNGGGAASDGWGVPMATDIAFAVGVLSLMGSRVPSSMRILLLALAIIDDLGAILIIALFYSSSIDPFGISIIVAGLMVMLLWVRFGVRPGLAYAVPLVILWSGLHIAGIHPTLAGVIVGLATPVRPWLSRDQFAGVAEESLGKFKERTKGTFDPHEIVDPLRRLAVAGREAISPVVRLETDLHPWVAYLIMPLFALANAGVDMGGVDISVPGATTVLLGVGLGLAIGKPLGVMLLTWIGVRLGWCTLPRGLSWSSILIVGVVAGIGFTMSIFIADLAYAARPDFGDLSKLAILAATAAAGVVGLGLGHFLLRPPENDVSPSHAEQSTEL